MNNDRIESIAGGGTVCTGKGIEVFQLLRLKRALRLEMVGLRNSRGSVLKHCKLHVTHLKTNDRAKHIAKIEEMIAEVAKLVNVPEPTNIPC